MRGVRCAMRDAPPFSIVHLGGRLIAGSCIRALVGSPGPACLRGMEPIGAKDVSLWQRTWGRSGKRLGFDLTLSSPLANLSPYRTHVQRHFRCSFFFALHFLPNLTSSSNYPRSIIPNILLCLSKIFSRANLDLEIPFPPPPRQVRKSTARAIIRAPFDVSSSSSSRPAHGRRSPRSHLHL